MPGWARAAAAPRLKTIRRRRTRLQSGRLVKHGWWNHLSDSKGRGREARTKGNATRTRPYASTLTLDP